MEHWEYRKKSSRVKEFRCWKPVSVCNNSSDEIDQQNIPGPRSGAASVVFGKKMYMFGGYGGGGRLDDFFEFDFELKRWKKVDFDGPGPGVRENNGVVEYGGKLYLFGGYNGTKWLNDFYEFDLDKKTWRLVVPEGSSVPAARFGYVSAVHKHYFVLFGGYDGITWLNDMHRFDFFDGKWEKMNTTGTIPSIRSCPSWCKEGDKVYVFGGYDGIQRMNDFYACNLNTYTWTFIPSLGDVPSPRYFHSCAVYGGCMYVFGGYDGTERLNDMYEHNFDLRRWKKLEHQDNAPIGRSSLVSQVYGSSIYIFGGYNGQVVLNDFHEYKFESSYVPPSTFFDDMKSMVNNRELSDVTFLVDGFPVCASRSFLAARSEHFRAMFYGGLRESQLGLEIEIKDINHAVFLKIMEYLYTDSVGELQLDLAIQLLMASERYLLDRLKSLCEHSIRKNITVDNVASIYLTAHKHNANDLKDICLDFILENIESVRITQAFNDLKSEPDLLMEIIMAYK